MGGTHVPGVPPVMHVHRTFAESSHSSPLTHVPVVGAPAVVVLLPMAGTASPLRAPGADEAPVPPELMGRGSCTRLGSSVSNQMSPCFAVAGGAFGPT